MIICPEIIVPICFAIIFITGYGLGRMDRKEKREKAEIIEKAEITDHEKNEKNTEMTIYVGNLPYKTTEEELQAVFGLYGEIDSIKIIKDTFNGKSKGFGFIQMPVGAEAEAAIKDLDGAELGNRMLKVNEARPLPKTYKRGEEAI